MRKLKGTLTNRQIDHYALTGYYGQATRQKWIDGLRSGKIRTLREEILRGDYGPEPQRALKERRVKRKRNKTTKEQGLAAIKKLGLEHLLEKRNETT